MCKKNRNWMKSALGGQPHREEKHSGSVDFLPVVSRETPVLLPGGSEETPQVTEEVPFLLPSHWLPTSWKGLILCVL